MSTLKLPGEISISRPSYGDGQEAIEITITDSGSGIEFVRAKMSLEVFARAVTGRSSGNCDLEIRGLDYLGMKHETKRETVAFKCSSYDDEVRGAAARDALRGLEVDGWRGRWRDLLNHHNRSRSAGDTYSVTFERYVARPEVQP